MKRLSYRQVLEIVSDKPVGELILVGGQALNAWAEALGLTDEFAEGVYGAALSDDIDFLGLAPAAIALADALGAEVKLAQFDDHTPNTAVVTFDFEGERSVIDVLGSLQGFSALELERVRAWAAIPEMPVALNNKLRVMHPVHCLQSQLENVYGLALNRRESADGEGNAKRVRLAHEVARRTILRYLDDEEPGSARAAIEHVYELAKRQPALRARATDGILVTDGLSTDDRLGLDFQEKLLPQLNGRLAKAIGKHEALLQRKAERAKKR